MITVLLPALLQTCKLMLTSFVVSVVLAFALGVWASLKPGGVADSIISLFAFAGISVPVFWLALVLILVFAVTWHVLPASGISTVGDGGVTDQLRHLILPVTTLALANIGAFTRFIRAAMIETLRMDHIRTARAKGAGERRVVLVHALRNAMIPVVTVIALSFGGLFSGALITETMFAQPGMGKMIYDAILGNDFNLALTGLLFATLVTLLANLLADLAYGWLTRGSRCEDGLRRLPLAVALEAVPPAPHRHGQPVRSGAAGAVRCFGRSGRVVAVGRSVRDGSAVAIRSALRRASSGH